MAAFATYTSAPAISAHIRPRSRLPSCTFTQSTPCRTQIFRCVHLNIIFISRLFSCSFRRYLHFATFSCSFPYYVPAACFSSFLFRTRYFCDRLFRTRRFLTTTATPAAASPSAQTAPAASQKILFGCFKSSAGFQLSISTFRPCGFA